jgi:hypothetical protein
LLPTHPSGERQYANNEEGAKYHMSKKYAIIYQKLYQAAVLVIFR